MINNETFGICCEIAIADFYNIKINNDYRKRGNTFIEKIILNTLKEQNIFSTIPKPCKHIAEDQNPVDFILENNNTLSVKSNYKNLGKVAPQILGQPTDKTFFEYFSDYFINYDLDNMNYEEKRNLFKNFVLNNIDTLIIEYWNHLFDTDYYIHFYNLLNNKQEYNNFVDYIIIEKSYPDFEKNKFTFTKNFEDWNESNTLKYDNISIGEFQVHKKRNCLKFRFNIKNLKKLNIINRTTILN